ncbi:MAG: hypothetical protein ACJ0F0_04560, partial [Burkholderiaceae bacterium]
MCDAWAHAHADVVQCPGCVLFSSFKFGLWQSMLECTAPFDKSVYGTYSTISQLASGRLRSSTVPRWKYRSPVL